ncbi:hypothetical protein K9U40_11955 [Xanthobacter autotrophicus]|uniref:hypothetical protein n=1 Tax=Xanthobacter TaxID=279 RepID=UPI0024ABA423|nr:hypothetical protein [Xanthobacter autotrophicus]MDI4665038.1 hypothetical protein [Xanthobacter autotrophicus]
MTTKKHIEAWRRAFETEENAVVPTLSAFAWNYAAFTTVVRVVDHAPVDAEGEKQLNGMVLELLRSTFWGSAVLAIRRMVDRGPLIGPKGVNSLAAIVNDARARRGKITRRVFIEEIAGLEYDFEAIDQRHWEHVSSEPPDKALWVPADLNPEPSRNRHREFDFLSGVAADSRSPADLIQLWVFDRLDARLARLESVADHATIHFAHPATAESQTGRGLETWGLNDANDAMKLLAETAELVGRWFLYSGIGDVLPHPQYDQFAHLDKPLVAPAVIPQLHAEWEKFSQEAAQWPFIRNECL